MIKIITWLKKYSWKSFAGAIILGVIGNGIYSLIAQVSIFSLILSFIKFLVIYPNIPLCLWLIILTMLVFSFYQSIKGMKKQDNLKNIKKIPEYAKTFKSHKIEEILWCWKYNSTYDDYVGLNPHCIECNTILKYPHEDSPFIKNQSPSFYCENCKEHYKAEYYGYQSNYDKAKRIISPMIKKKIDEEQVK